MPLESINQDKINNVIYESSEENIKKAALLLKEGKIIAIPTETVYGLAADASNEQAVAHIFKIKGRPNFNPLISHYSELDEIEKDVVINDKVKLLAENFWPGPMTLVLNKTKDSRISKLVSANLHTAAVRIPKHQVSLKILKAFQGPVAAPSANPSGCLSPSEAQHVETMFSGTLSFILDGGACKHGLESTVIDLSSEKTKILRYGSITKEKIEEILQETVLLPESESGIKAPGMLLRHYAPKTELKIDLDLAKYEFKQDKNKKLGLILYGDNIENQNFINNHSGNFIKIINLSKESDLYEAAHNLFRFLHMLDNLKLDKILIQKIPNTEVGVAINDRLKRAAQK